MLKNLIITAAMMVAMAPVKLLQAEIPGFEKAVYLDVNGQSAPDFLHSLFNQIGLTVKVDHHQ